MTAPAIALDGATKLFYPAAPFGAWIQAPWRRSPPITALDRISLAIAPGELFCLMGPNGAGKTTLLRLLMGLLVPTSGILRIDGHEPDRHTRAITGFAAADHQGCYDRLTGRQNLAFFACLYGLRGQQLRHRVDKVLRLMEIGAPDQRYQEYSSGTKQRLLLARALLHEPRVLVLDEPTRSLDPVEAQRVHALLTGRLLKQGAAILLTTHQVWEAQVLADRLAVLHGGRIRACGTVDEVRGGSTLEEAVRRLCAS